MAVVHMEIDIDGDVYPELYAALAALRQPMLRDERMRQLAAMGLAWEALRLHGPPAMQLSRSVAMQPAEPVHTPVVAPAPGSSPKSTARASGRNSPGKMAVKARAPDQPELPVLVDVVAMRSDETALPEPPVVDDGPVAPVDPMPIHAASRGPGSRTRLMRMKDRGLFKNG
jgi:hypothetical protein